MLLLVGVAHADVIYLSSGGIVKGTIVKKSQDSITVRTAGGSTSIIPMSEVERIEEGASPEAMYRERLAKIPLGDAEGHYQLGLWLKRINCRELAREEFQKTIMLEPEHKFARDELGYNRDQAGRWVLPHETSEDEPVVAPQPKREAAPEPKPAELALDPNGLSVDLAQTLSLAVGKDSTKGAFEKLDGALDQESNRIVDVLMGPFSKAREKVAQAVSKTVPGSDATIARVPSEGSKDEALKADLKAQTDTYVEKTVKPTVITAVHHAERAAANDLIRSNVIFRTFVKDFHSDSALKRREKAWSDWDKAREVAIKTIFDLKIYPDENHGRVGQKIVDEKVDAVRAVWQFLDPQVQRDLSRFLATTEAEAGRAIKLLDEARGRQQACVAWLEGKGEKVDAQDAGSPIEECLLRYRAGDIDGALAMASKLSPYEKELLKRLRDQRVLDYNDAFKKTPTIKQGKNPDGLEIEQVAITNEYRIMMGRAAIEIDTRLVEASRGHSEEMTRLGYFEHTSPVGANKTPWDRMKNAGYEGAGGENISLGSEAPKATHIAWYNSSGHHRNILGEQWSAMGAGRNGRHWTQDFGGAAGLLKR
jgi:uncharacterized protein YkwD